MFSELKYFIPALIAVSSNIRVLNSMALYMPGEKASNMLDLLNWSMNACYQE